MLRQDSPNMVRTPRDHWQNMVETCVHCPEESQKACYKMFQRALSALANLKNK